MKNRMKRVLAGLLALTCAAALALSAAGCSCGKDEDENKPEPAVTQPTVSDSTAPTTADGADLADLAEPAEPATTTTTTAPETDAIRTAVLVGNLPKDGEIIEDETFDGGYSQTIFVDAVAALTTARYPSEYDLQKALAAKGWNIDVDSYVYTTPNGWQGFRDVWTKGSNEDTAVCEAFYFNDGNAYYLFLSSMPSDYYYGMMDPELGPSGDDVTAWIDSLDLFYE